MPRNRIAHYISSTHWDREWYQPFQGYRFRLVALLDEVFSLMQRDKQYRFTMDGQVIPIFDYLEVRPEKRAEIEGRIKEGRLTVGPWFDLPDEWLVSGESLIRNLQMGMKLSTELGGTSRAGTAIDLFGHNSQLPQIFAQLGCLGTLIWRGTHEKENFGLQIWQAADGTRLPAYRFGQEGYVSFWKEVRKPMLITGKFDKDLIVTKLIEFVRMEAKRTPEGPILLFDGGDHCEIEPHITELIAAANAQLQADGIEIVQSSLDEYLKQLQRAAPNLTRTLVGELRETGRDPIGQDSQWLIPGVYSSRIGLKQANAACEDALTLWAEPFAAFAAGLGAEYPQGYFDVAWKWLLTNHPHDSICGCSIDQVHKDMVYRFDQCQMIADELAERAMRTIAVQAAPQGLSESAVVVTVFNTTAVALNEMVDVDVRLPQNWPRKYQEFFGFESKCAILLRTADGQTLPWQLVAQRQHDGFRIKPQRFPESDPRQIVSITVPLQIPALGYVTLIVEPAEGPTRFLGTMLTSHRTMENEFLRVEVAGNGTLTLTDKRTGRTFDQLLTFEERADIGDGWYHGLAVNDQLYFSTASAAEVGIIADGPHKATLRIAVTMHVPEAFDFRLMQRRDRLVPLKIVSDVTLRRGSDRVEVATTVENTVRDHRVRVLLPTQLQTDTYMADSAFDAVTRKIALAADNACRRELDVETRPQQTWTALTDGTAGLALVTRGLPESAVSDTPDRPICLTLLRGFAKAVFQGRDISTGGQVLGTHHFRYCLVPFGGEVPVVRLFQLGQRILHPVRQCDQTPWDREPRPPTGTLPPTQSFLSVDGSAVVTSVQRQGGKLLVRLFNPTPDAAPATLQLAQPITAAKPITLAGKPADLAVEIKSGAATLTLPPKRIVTLLLTSGTRSVSDGSPPRAHRPSNVR